MIEPSDVATGYSLTLTFSNAKDIIKAGGAADGFHYPSGGTFQYLNAQDYLDEIVKSDSKGYGERALSFRRKVLYNKQ